MSGTQGGRVFVIADREPGSWLEVLEEKSDRRRAPRHRKREKRQTRLDVKELRPKMKRPASREGQ